MNTEKQTLAEKFPWATEGAKAVIYSQGSWGYLAVTVVTITKVTKARVTVSNGTVFYTRDYANELREHGRGEWYGAPQLVRTDDPVVAEARERIRKKKAETAAKGATQTFTQSRNVDNAHKAVAALLDYIEANKEEA